MRSTYPTLLLCLLTSSAASAQELGRLFTTPEQRVALDRARNGARPVNVAARVPGFAVAAPAGAAQAGAAQEGAPSARRRPLKEGERILVVNGVVRRSGSGRVTTWIDAVPHTTNERVGAGAQLRDQPDQRGATVEMTLGSGKNVRLKPGQTVDAVSGRVREAYQPMWVRTPARAPVPTAAPGPQPVP